MIIISNILLLKPSFLDLFRNILIIIGSNIPFCAKIEFINTLYCSHDKLAVELFALIA